MIRMSLKKTTRPIRHFLREYFMVVVGVLTALALEQWVLHLNHRSDAVNAAARIESELRVNIAAIRQDRKLNAAHLDELVGIRDTLVRDIKAHRAPSEISRYLLASKGDFNLDLRWPVLHHEAWDVAVADQSINWIDTERARRFASAYAVMRETDHIQQADMSLTMQASPMSNVMADLRIGQVEPRQYLHAISSMTAILQDSVHMLDHLDKVLSTDLDNDAAHEPDAGGKS